MSKMFEYRIDDSVALQSRDPDTGVMVDVLCWRFGDVVLIHPDRVKAFIKRWTKGPVLNGDKRIHTGIYP